MVKEMTETNLRSAYAGESQANMRYTIYAKRATEEGYPNVARLFTAIAYAEQIHASNHHKNIESKGPSLTVSGGVVRNEKHIRRPSGSYRRRDFRD